MFNINKYNVLFVFTLAAFLSSCKDKEVVPDVETPVDTLSVNGYGQVNSWLYDVMNDVYFWYKDMPARTSLDSTVTPEDYFEKLIYKRETVDRFSMVTNDIDALQNEFNGVSKIFGISYSLSFIDEGNSNLGVFLNYVVKGSPADKAGLKRGDIILKVNGTPLTAANYAALLGGNETVTFNLGTLNGTEIVAGNESVSVTKAEVSENPVAFSTVISKPSSGKVIGYLVYTQFIPGNDSTDTKYDDELRQVFADFKAKGVNELVLDLRFNGGGYISSAETLASLIGRNVSPSKTFYTEQWNDKYLEFWKQNNGPTALTYPFLNEPNNIGTNLSRVFVLTSNGTASASELVINGLKPYMDVITIGEHTAGKNLFGSLISDDQNRWKWGAYVMLGQTANSNGESDYGTIDGMRPNYIVEDSSVPYKAFGDENETLLNKALTVMGVATTPNTRVAAAKKVNAFSKLLLRDDLQVIPNRMIKTKKTVRINH